MAVRGFLHPEQPPARGELHQWARRMWESYYKARHGKLDCVAEFTLTANAATSTLTFEWLSPQSVVTFDPKTANAATEKAAGTLYVLTANRGNKTWTVTHANNAQADRTFQVSIIG